MQTPHKSLIAEHLSMPVIRGHFRHSEDFDRYADYLSDLLLTFQQSPLHYGYLARYEPAFAEALSDLLTPPPVGSPHDVEETLSDEAETAAVYARQLYTALCESYVLEYYGIDPQYPDESTTPPSWDEILNP